MNSELIAFGLLSYVVFLFSTTCHEAAHALAAKLGGDLTAFRGGQVSLNPIPHIRREPFGMVIVPLIAAIAGGGMIGWASAPYDPLWQQRYPKRAALMSLAGPAANFTLVLVAGILIRMAVLTGTFHVPDSLGYSHLIATEASTTADAIARLLSLLFSMNLLLGAFNLLPIPPLDGFTVLGLFLPEEAAARLQSWGRASGMFAMVGLLVCWRVFPSIYGPLFVAAVRLLYPGYGA